MPKKISVRVKPYSKNPGVELINSLFDDGQKEYVVNVTAGPQEGKANKELLERLSEHFNIPKSKFSIIKGFKSRNKVIEINDD